MGNRTFQLDASSLLLFRTAFFVTFFTMSISVQADTHNDLPCSADVVVLNGSTGGASPSDRTYNYHNCPATLPLSISISPVDNVTSNMVFDIQNSTVAVIVFEYASMGIVNITLRVLNVTTSSSRGAFVYMNSNATNVDVSIVASRLRNAPASGPFLEITSSLPHVKVLLLTNVSVSILGVVVPPLWQPAIEGALLYASCRNGVLVVADSTIHVEDVVVDDVNATTTVAGSRLTLVMLDQSAMVWRSTVLMRSISLSCRLPGLFGANPALSNISQSTVTLVDIRLGRVASSDGPALCVANFVNAQTVVAMSTLGALDNETTVTLKQWKLEYAGPVWILFMGTASNGSSVSVFEVTACITVWLNMSALIMVSLDSLHSDSTLELFHVNVTLYSWRTPLDKRLISLPADFANLVPFTDQYIPPVFFVRLQYGAVDSRFHLHDCTFVAIGTEGFVVVRAPRRFVRSEVFVHNVDVTLEVLFIGYMLSLDGQHDACNMNVTNISFRSLSNANVTMIDLSRGQLWNGSNFTLSHWIANVSNYPNYPKWTMVESILFKHQASYAGSVVTYRHGSYDAYLVNSSGSVGLLSTYFMWHNSTLRMEHIMHARVRCASQNVLVSFIHPSAIRSNSVLDISNVRASVANTTFFCIVCVGLHENSSATVTFVVVDAYLNPVGSGFPTIGITVLKPGGTGVLTIHACALTFVGVGGGGAIGLMTATSLNFTVVIITNSSLNVTQQAGTVSVMSSGVAFSSSVTLAHIQMTSTTPLTAVLASATIILDCIFNITDTVMDARPAASFSVLTYQQLMVNTSISIQRVISAPGVQCWIPSLVGTQAVAASIVNQFFPQEASDLIPLIYSNFSGTINVSIAVSEVVWKVTCVSVFGIGGSCVLLGLHETQEGLRIHIHNTTAEFTSTVASNEITMGVVLLSGSPQLSAGDFVAPMSKSGVSLTDVTVSLTNVSIRASFTLTTAQRVFLVSVDATSPSQQNPNRAAGIMVQLEGCSMVVPRNASLVNIGILANTQNEVRVRYVTVMFSATTTNGGGGGSSSSSSTFRVISFAPVFASDAPNCTVSANASVALAQVVGVAVHRASCGGSPSCDHVVVDMSPVVASSTNILGFTTYTTVRLEWHSVAVSVAPWDVRFVDSLSSGAEVFLLRNALRLVGAGGANVTGNTSLVVATASTSSSTLVEMLVYIGALIWCDTASLKIVGGGMTYTMPSSAWADARPLVTMDLLIDPLRTVVDSATSWIRMEDVACAWNPVSDAAASTDPVSLLAVSVAIKDAQTFASSEQPALGGLRVVLRNVTVRVLSSVMPQRTTALAVLSGPASLLEFVEVVDCLLDLGGASVRTPVSSDASSEALVVIRPPQWLSSSLSAFPRRSWIAKNRVLLPTNKATVKLTYTTAVRPFVDAQVWFIPSAASPEQSTFLVQCNTINTVTPLVRADPTAIPQNITTVCDTFTREVTMTQTCDAAGVSDISVSPLSAPLYRVYRGEGTFVLSWVSSTQRFNVPLIDPERYLDVSWGRVRRVAGARCDEDPQDNSSSSSGGEPGGASDGGRCRSLVVALDTGTEQVILSNTYVVQLRLSPTFLDCPAGDYVSFSLLYDRVTLPTPQVARDIASAGAIEAALVGGIVGSASIGFAVSRSALVFQLSACAFSDSEPMTRYDSPFRISFGGMNGAYIRGAVIGNCLLVALMVVLALLIALVLHVHRQMKASGESVTQSLRWLSIQSLSAKTHSPSNLVIPGSWVLQSTVGACFTLLWEHFDGAADIVVALAGLSMTLGLLVKYYYCIVFRLPVNCRGTRRVLQLPTGRPVLVSDYFQWLMGSNTQWRQLHYAEDPGFKHKYFELFTQYVPEYRWYMILETLVCVSMGVLQGIRPSTADGCQSVAYVVLTISVAMLLYSAYAKPYATRFDELILQVNNAFTAVCSILLAIPSDAPGFAAAADGIAMTQVYVSTALTLLWLLHHLNAIKAVVDRLMGNSVRISREGKKAPTLSRRRSPSRRGRGKRPSPRRGETMEEGATEMVNVVLPQPSEADRKKFKKRLADLARDERDVCAEIQSWCVRIATQKSRKEWQRERLCRLDVLIRLIYIQNMRRRIDEAQMKLNA